MDYLEVEDARDRSGLRLVLTAGVPGPWGESAKAIFAIKKIPFVPVRQAGGEANDALFAWTGARNAPVAVFGDEPPCSGWNEIVLLAERIAPDPPLLPANPEARAVALGLSHEICGPDGFGWCRRLLMLDEILGSVPSERQGGRGFAVLRTLADRYGYDPEGMAAVRHRLADLLALFANRLRSQRERDSGYLVGDLLTAPDLHWATFAAMVEPLPPELCPMPDGLRGGYTLRDPELCAVADPILLEHRDRIYRDHLTLPMEF